MITPEVSIIDNIERFAVIVHIKRGRSPVRTFNYFEKDKNLSKGSCATLRECAELIYEIYQFDWYLHVRIKPELIIELSDLMSESEDLGAIEREDTNQTERSHKSTLHIPLRLRSFL